MISSPKPPSATELGGAQFTSNKDTATFNQLLNGGSTKTPFGSEIYTQGKPLTFKDSTGKTITVPQLNRELKLDPMQQKTLGIQNDAAVKTAATARDLTQNARKTLSSPVNTSGIQSWQGAAEAPTLDTSRISAPQLQTQFADSGDITKTYGSNDFSADRGRVEEALMSRYRPEFERTEAALDTKLRNQGLVPGSEAYNTQFDQLGRMRNDATFQSILAGGEEQSRLTGLERDRASFQNDAQSQQFGQDQARGLFSNQFTQGNFDNSLTSQDAFNRHNATQYTLNQSESDAKNSLRTSQLGERTGLRNQTLNELAALKGGTQINTPQFQAPFQQSTAAVPIADMMNQQYQAELSRSNSRAQGLFGLLGAGASILSDENMKTDIEELGDDPKTGIPMYAYRYKDDPKTYPKVVGPMAQDIEKMAPWMVKKVGGRLVINHDPNEGARR